jgi:hypothetical protein
MSKPVTWSHSGLKDFEGCARRFHEVKVAKRYPSKDTIHTIYGKEVHKAIELYGRDGKPLDERFAQFQPTVDAISPSLDESCLSTRWASRETCARARLKTTTAGSEVSQTC